MSEPEKRCGGCKHFRGTGTDWKARPMGKCECPRPQPWPVGRLYGSRQLLAETTDCPCWAAKETTNGD